MVRVRRWREGRRERGAELCSVLRGCKLNVEERRRRRSRTLIVAWEDEPTRVGQCVGVGDAC